MLLRPRRSGLVALAVTAAGCGRLAFSEQPPSDAIADVAPHPVVLASDDFERGVNTGWGTAPIGGPWSLFNPKGAVFSVAGGTAFVQVNSSPTYADAALTPRARDVEARVVVAVDHLPSTAFYLVRLSARVSADSTGYALDTRIHADGSFGGFLLRSIDPVVQNLTTEAIAITGVAAGDRIALALSTTRAAPTVLCAKIWRETDPEPATCTFTASDGAPELEAPGQAFLGVDTNGAPAPVTIAFDTFRYLRVGSM